MLHKVLIANRGEIACRVIRACRELGIATVAVYAEPDANAKHVREADEAHPLGGTTALETYLNIDALLAIAAATGADAVHPGYGFLAENAAFAQACGDAGVTFIGPTPAAIADMGSKRRAKDVMDEAGVPTLPGVSGVDLDDAGLAAAAEKLGYPVLIKASAGGGGKGMQAVHDAADFPAALASVRRVAGAAFGDDAILLERYLAAPRHVEVQILADQSGTTIALGERDCSLQRRHQKILEESPCTVLEDGTRTALHAAAVAAARAVGYVGAGTVEFLLAADGAFYFLEMNTRLQVEHPVTEFVTGVDLVKWQLRIAAGASLTVDAAAATPRGHAIECRVYAEDAGKGFLPATGQVSYLRHPEGIDVRVDSGVDAGDAITVYFDPMLAKIIVRGEDRADALRKMAWALDHYVLLGVQTNVAFLKALIADTEVIANRISTQYVEAAYPAWRPPTDVDHDVLVAVAVAELVRAGAPAAEGEGGERAHDPFAVSNRWRVGE